MRALPDQLATLKRSFFMQEDRAPGQTTSPSIKMGRKQANIIDSSWICLILRADLAILPNGRTLVLGSY